MKYTLVCMAFDGEWVHENVEFDNPNSAWLYEADMGSKWYFYPFCFVVTESLKTVVDAGIMDCLNGKRLDTVSKLFKSISQRPEAKDDDVYMFVRRVREEMLGIEIAPRLAYFRKEIKAHRMSWGDIAELESLAEFIPADDVLLREWVGIPEFEEGE